MWLVNKTSETKGWLANSPISLDIVHWLAVTCTLYFEPCYTVMFCTSQSIKCNSKNNINSIIEAKCMGDDLKWIHVPTAALMPSGSSSWSFMGEKDTHNISQVSQRNINYHRMAFLISTSIPNFGITLLYWLYMKTYKMINLEWNSKHLMIGLEGNGLFSFPRIPMFSIFPEVDSDSREPKLTVSQGTSLKVIIWKF